MEKEPLAKSIAGEITLSEEPGKVMKKWREIFGIKQSKLASLLKVSPSVISDYEAERRKSPGTKFVKKFIQTLISYDLENKERVVERLSLKKEEAILDMREFLTPLKASQLVKVIRGKVLSNQNLLEKNIFGYTVIDSIKAILDLNEKDLLGLYGLNPKRALIFTKVGIGRSPMIAIRVTNPKPRVVILQGLKPQDVDKLAIKISRLEKIPLVVSLNDEKELVENLKKLEN